MITHEELLDYAVESFHFKRGEGLSPSFTSCLEEAFRVYYPEQQDRSEVSVASMNASKQRTAHFAIMNNCWLAEQIYEKVGRKIPLWSEQSDLLFVALQRLRSCHCGE